MTLALKQHRFIARNGGPYHALRPCQHVCAQCWSRRIPDECLGAVHCAAQMANEPISESRAVSSGDCAFKLGSIDFPENDQQIKVLSELTDLEQITIM